MKRNKIKTTAFIIIIMLIMQLLLNTIIPIKSIAAEEIITIKCNDINFYNALIKEIGEKKIQSKDENKKTISMTRTEVENVSRLVLLSSEITDLTGIEKFTNLDELILDHNNISEITPLEGLTNLKILHLYNNNISEITPLEGLTNLKILYLYNNNISEITPLEGLTNLKTLLLDNNNISKIPLLEGLTNLVNLSLSNNNISEITPLEGLKNLVNLDLSNNNISEITPLEGLTNLKNLWLENSNISEITPLEGLTNLKILHLSNNNISEITPLAGLTNLTYLDLYNNNISKIPPLEGLTNLVNLSLSNNNISEITSLEGLTKLVNLYLSNNNISEITPLEGLTNLTTLSLSNNSITTTIKEETKEIELPQIIKAAKDTNSKIYTEKDYVLSNCTLSTDGTKIIRDTNQETEASVTIVEGAADGTKFTVKIDNNPPEIEVRNSITTLTNQNVTVTITANEEIQEVEGWNRSDGKTKLTKEFTENGEETVEVKDLAGNITKANIKVDNIDKTPPEVEVSYSNKQPTTEKVKVTIKPNEEIKIPIGWILDEQNKVIYKEYDANTEEKIQITDLAGNQTEVAIKIENIIKANNNKEPNSSNNQGNNSNNQKNKGDNILSKGSLPDTGIKISVIMIITLVLIYGTIQFVKYRKYKDIK